MKVDQVPHFVVFQEKKIVHKEVNLVNLFKNNNFKKNDQFSIGWAWNGDEEELNFCLEQNCLNDEKQFHYNNGQFQLFEESSQSDLGDGYYLTEGVPNNVKPQAFKTDTGMVIVKPNRDGVLNSTAYTYNEDGIEEPHILVEQLQ